MSSESLFKVVANRMAELVEKKNAAYGNSFEDCGAFLKTLWPNGVPVEAYPFMLTFVRVFDKMKRIANDPGAFGEDPVNDILGYALLMAEMQERGKRAQARHPGEDVEAHTPITPPDEPKVHQ